MTDRLEFYNGKRIIASVDSSIVPIIGSKISIRKKTWEIISVTYAIDYVDATLPALRTMRANIDLKKYKAK